MTMQTARRVLAEMELRFSPIPSPPRTQEEALATERVLRSVHLPFMIEGAMTDAAFTAYRGVKIRGVPNVTHNTIATCDFTILPVVRRNKAWRNRWRRGIQVRLHATTATSA